LAAIKSLGQLLSAPHQILIASH